MWPPTAPQPMRRALQRRTLNVVIFDADQADPPTGAHDPNDHEAAGPLAAAEPGVQAPPLLVIEVLQDEPRDVPRAPRPVRERVERLRHSRKRDIQHLLGLLSGASPLRLVAVVEELPERVRTHAADPSDVVGQGQGRDSERVRRPVQCQLLDVLELVVATQPGRHQIERLAQRLGDDGHGLMSVEQHAVMFGVTDVAMREYVRQALAELEDEDLGQHVREAGRNGQADAVGPALQPGGALDRPEHAVCRGPGLREHPALDRVGALEQPGRAQALEQARHRRRRHAADPEDTMAAVRRADLRPASGKSSPNSRRRVSQA